MCACPSLSLPPPPFLGYLFLLWLSCYCVDAALWYSPPYPLLSFLPLHICLLTTMCVCVFNLVFLHRQIKHGTHNESWFAFFCRQCCPPLSSPSVYIFDRSSPHCWQRLRFSSCKYTNSSTRTHTHTDIAEVVLFNEEHWLFFFRLSGITTTERKKTSILKKKNSLCVFFFFCCCFVIFSSHLLSLVFSGTCVRVLLFVCFVFFLSCNFLLFLHSCGYHKNPPFGFFIFVC